MITRFLKTILFCIILQTALNSSPSSALEKFVVISDIDDTIRISDVLTPHRLIWNVFETDSTFLGMNELYQQWAKNAESINYISGSPQFLKPTIENLLFHLSDFPEGPVFLRNWFYIPRYAKVGPLKGIYYYKTEILNQLHQLWIQKSPDSPLPHFVFMGDNEESDPEIYRDFLKDSTIPPVTTTYIHRVLPVRALPDHQISYSTAFEIALHEVMGDRLTADQAIHVGRTILESTRPELLFPVFKYCPTQFDYESGLLESLKNRAEKAPTAEQASFQKLLKLTRRFKDYVRAYCTFEHI